MLDTCGGLGYFAAWCLQGQASRVAVLRKEPGRDLAAQSQSLVTRARGATLTLTHGDVVKRSSRDARGSVDAILHDPPRFGIAGELYSQTFYDQLARVLKRNGAAVPLHRHAEQAHRRRRRAERSGDAVAPGRVHDRS